MNYIIFADSACDISKKILDAWGVKQVKMSLRFTDEDKEYICDEMSTEEFYADMRRRTVPAMRKAGQRDGRL